MVIRWVMFAVVAFFILFPVYWIFISSITPPGELFKKPIDYLPDHPTLESYSFLIQNVGLLAKIGSTVIIIGVYDHLCDGRLWICEIQVESGECGVWVYRGYHVDPGSGHGASSL